LLVVLFFFCSGCSVDQTWAIISQLPSDLQKKMGYQNARSVFNLP